MQKSVDDGARREICWQHTNYERFIPKQQVTSVSVTYPSESSYLGISIYFRHKLIYLFPRLIQFAAKIRDEFREEKERSLLRRNFIETDKVYSTRNFFKYIPQKIQRAPIDLKKYIFYNFLSFLFKKNTQRLL